MATIKDALKHKVSYPLGDGFFDDTLVIRGLNGGDTFTQAIGIGREFNLAYADCLVRYATAVNVHEGDLSVSLPADPALLISIANGIYNRYGEPTVQLGTEPVATATYIGEDWMEDW